MGNKINLSTIADDSCVRTMIKSLKDLYESELSIEKDVVKNHIEYYISEYSDLLLDLLNKDELVTTEFTSDQSEIHREELRKIIEKELSRKSTLSEKEERDKVQKKINCLKRDLDDSYNMNSSIYNLNMLLIFIDENLAFDNDILLDNSLAEYKDCDLLIKKKNEYVINICLGVSDYCISANQRHKIFNWGSHYNSSPNTIQLLNNQRKYQVYKSAMKELELPELKKGDCFISDVLLMIDLIRIQRQCLYEKFKVALLFIQKSFEYSAWMRELALSLTNILNELLFCGQVHKIYVQQRQLNTQISAEGRTSKDATTRISIIASVSNDDFYIFRIDMPHAGEENFHLNIEEVIDDSICETGYPLSKDEEKMLRKELGIDLFKELFFECSDRYWFRSKFKSLISKKVDNKEYERLEKILRKKSHIAIDVGISVNDDQIIEFTEELKKYLSRFRMEDTSFLSFDKDNINYPKEIKKLRGLYTFEERILKELIKVKKDTRESILTVIEILEKYTGIEFKDKEISSIIEVYEALKEQI